MNAITFNVPNDIQGKIEKIAAEKGVSVEALLEEITARAIGDFEAHKLFLEMSRQGAGEIEQALDLLRR